MKTNDSEPAATVNLSREDHGKQISLKTGDRMVIRLRTTPTTGFDWQVENLDSSILVEEPRSYRVVSDALGSPSDLEIHFKVIGGGKTRLSLVYQRSWEKGIAPADEFLFAAQRALDIEHAQPAFAHLHERGE